MSIALTSLTNGQNIIQNQLSSLQNLSSAAAGSASTSADGTLMFQDIYNNLVSNVNSTDSTFQADMVKAAEGELDDPHQLLIDSEQANVALELVLSVRNKALTAYDDITKIQI